MSNCPVCNHEHGRFLEYALEENFGLLNHLSRFYEIGKDDLMHHMNHCTSRFKSGEPVHGGRADGE
jgi:hypothetical protein